MRRVTCLLVLAGLLLWGAAPAGAETNLRLGPLKLVPSLKLTGEWNDNIYEDPENGEEDFVWDLNFAIKLVLDAYKNRNFELGYDTSYFSFNSNTANDYGSHNVYAKYQHELGPRMYYKLGDKFLYTEDQYGSEDEYNRGEQTKRWNNKFDGLIGYRFNDEFKLEVFYMNGVEQYLSDDDEYQDYIEHRPGMTLFYQIMPKTSIIAEYKVAFRTYNQQNDGFSDASKTIDDDTSQDYVYHKILTGVNWDATAKVRGSAKVGVGIFDYANDKDWKGEDYEDSTDWIAEVNLSYAMAPKTTIRGKVDRSQRPTTTDNANSFDKTGFGIGLDQTLPWELKLALDGSYTMYDYDSYDSQEERNDDEYMAKAALKYPFTRYFDGSLTYTFKRRDSTINDEAFTNNIIGLALTGHF